MEDNKQIVFDNAQLKKAKNELEGEVEVLKKRVRDLQIEVENYKNTLAKIPPELVDKRFKPGIQARSLRFKMATVLYIDIQGFKEIAINNDSREMIDQLDQIFVQFDEIAEKHKISRQPDRAFCGWWTAGRLWFDRTQDHC